ncbi:MAG: helix-turn-helix domain-containing protein [Solobacterium sp.]|nr:helix-turn-helix domain-containing protein [Solobacterium sp.]
MTELKTRRLEKKLTQREVSKRIGISLRSYIMYENDESKEDTPKYRFLLQELDKINPLDESNGILSLEDIKRVCADIFTSYQIDFCYLFGSYAKGHATGESDVDLLISTETTGLRYFEMTERLRQGLHKKVDLLDLKQLLNNEELLREVMKWGIRIYG